MKTQKMNRDDADKVHVTVQNAYTTATITDGQFVVWDYDATTGTNDGIGVTIAEAALLSLCAGVVDSTSGNGIASGEYGYLQVYGHNADALVTGTTDVAIGDPLKLTAAKFYADKAVVDTTASSEAVSYPIVAGEPYTTAGAAAKKVFLRCM